MTADHNARDDAIVLAALPGQAGDAQFALWKAERLIPHSEAVDRACKAIRRLKHANFARYVRATKRWERVV